MTDTMLAAVLHGIQDLRIEQRAIESPAAGMALLRVRRAGVCGSDIHYFQEGRFGSFAVTAPFILGHEVAGEVVAVGEGVSQLEIGQRVAVNPSRQCGHCDYCRQGRGNLCRFVRMLGSASTKPPTNGAFSEYLVVGAEQCFPLPDSMDDALAAMMEPLSVALQAAHRAGSVAGRRVLVTGGGPIGMLVALVARAFGASTVAVSDPEPMRRQLACSLGVDLALDPTNGNMEQQVRDAVDDGFDVLFEASGAVAAIQEAFQTVRRGGTIVQIGVSSESEIALAVNQLMIRELQFVGSFRYGDVWEEGIRLVASGRLDISPLVSQVFPFRQAARALQTAAARGQSLKVQLNMLADTMLADTMLADTMLADTDQ